MTTTQTNTNQTNQTSKKEKTMTTQTTENNSVKTDRYQIQEHRSLIKSRKDSAERSINQINIREDDIRVKANKINDMAISQSSSLLNDLAIKAADEMRLAVDARERAHDHVISILEAMEKSKKTRDIEELIEISSQVSASYQSLSEAEQDFYLTEENVNEVFSQAESAQEALVADASDTGIQANDTQDTDASDEDRTQDTTGQDTDASDEDIYKNLTVSELVSTVSISQYNSVKRESHRDLTGYSNQQLLEFINNASENLSQLRKSEVRLKSMNKALFLREAERVRKGELSEEEQRLLEMKKGYVEKIDTLLDEKEKADLDIKDMKEKMSGLDIDTDEGKKDFISFQSKIKKLKAKIADADIEIGKINEKIDSLRLQNDVASDLKAKIKKVLAILKERCLDIRTRKCHIYYYEYATLEATEQRVDIARNGYEKSQNEWKKT